MAHRQRTLIGVTDSQMIELADKLIETLGFTEAKVRIGGLGVELPHNSPELSDYLANEEGQSLSQISLNKQPYSVTVYHRKTVNDQGQTQDHPFYDAAHIFVNEADKNNKPTTPEAIKLFLYIDDFFRERNCLLQTAHSAESADIDDARLRAIENGAADQVARTEKFFIELQERFDKRFKELDDTYVAKSASLEADRLKTTEIFEEQKRELDLQRSELKDRDNTHERRTIREQISQSISTRLSNFRFSRGTSWYAAFVHFSFLVLILILGGLTYLSTTALTNQLTVDNLAWGPKIILTAVKQFFSLLALLALGTAYIRWLIGVYQRKSELETKLHQTGLDVERASWVVESLLEWRKAGEEPIPDQLLSAVTRGLFEDDRTESSSALSAGDHLASALLGSASKVKLNTGASEIELTGKGVKALNKNKSD